MILVESLASITDRFDFAIGKSHLVIKSRLLDDKRGLNYLRTTFEMAGYNVSTMLDGLKVEYKRTIEPFFTEDKEPCPLPNLRTEEIAHPLRGKAVYLSEKNPVFLGCFVDKEKYHQNEVVFTDDAGNYFHLDYAFLKEYPFQQGTDYEIVFSGIEKNGKYRKKLFEVTKASF